ncbi:MAG TPA: 3-oxoacyl-ACP reductase FabG [Gaiella sp.]|nr:3-oxoacyl-ACP reductase FabG [Gaiella sp.]
MTRAATGAGCALVTGASRGIGAAIARGLAADGWPVAVNYRESSRAAEATAAAIRDAGGEAVAIRADVASPAAADELWTAIDRELGRPVLVLVNNAAALGDALTPSMGDDDWHRVIETNLGAAFRLTRRALGPMGEARFGRVVNIASIVGPRGNPGQANYAASKAGLIGFTRAVAVEYARRSVTVNAIAPGVIETDSTYGKLAGMRSAIPAGRAGTPEEVAACARFLVSPGAGYVTGTVLTVDGGLSA